MKRNVNNPSEISKKIDSQFKRLLKSKRSKSKLRSSLILIFLGWILIGVFYRNIPPEVPLFFSKPWGEDQLQDKWFLFVLMGSVTVAYILNVRFASMSFKNDKLLANIFLVAQLFFSILVLAIISRLIWLVA
jgi:hypothetical protein